MLYQLSYLSLGSSQERDLPYLSQLHAAGGVVRAQDWESCALRHGWEYDRVDFFCQSSPMRFILLRSKFSKTGKRDRKSSEAICNKIRSELCDGGHAKLLDLSDLREE